MSKKLWSGRFAKETNPEVEAYTASISFDHQLVYEDILGSLAHTKMLESCRLINKEESQQIQEGLKQIANRVNQEQIQFNLKDEDIHMNIERLLTETIGDVAGKLHTARSRNDQVALDIHLYLRKQIIFILDLLTQLQKTLLKLAKKHHKTILPGYTHLQRAQPIYLAQYWLAYVSMFLRDSDRLQQNWTHINKSPLGACALTGTTFKTDKYYLAAELGFNGIYINTLDAVSDRDFIIQFLSASSLIMMHISRLSEELILWSSQEFNFISFDDAFSTGSSIMPQKKNPDVAELARGKTGRVYAALFSLLTLLKGLPLTYNKDLQEDKEPLFDTVKTLTLTLKIFSPLLATLNIHSEKMRQAVDVGYLNATALAEYLVKKGIAFRSAHEIVGKMVAFCLHKNCNLENLSLQDMRNFSLVIDEDVYQSLSIENIVAACNQDSDASCEIFEKQVQANQLWILEKQDLLKNIYTKFDIPFKVT